MNEQTIMDNPFLETYHTPHHTHPFDRIRMEHYKPAFHEGMKRQNAEIDAIVSNPETPTFANTIVALERSGELLERVCQVFFNLTGRTDLPFSPTYQIKDLKELLTLL